jgi:DNA-binding NarL/FixJ family response regulator
MKIALFSTDLTMTDEWESRIENAQTSIVSTVAELTQEEFDIIIADFDTVATNVNAFFTQGNVPKNLVVLEKSPANATGKVLIQNGVMAYGNSRMLRMHLEQLLQAVTNNKIWVYPELLKSIIKLLYVHEDLDENLVQRLSKQETEVVKWVLQGLSNDAISQHLGITVRTVKAHISSIFSKLHVNDRLNLVLLLKA